MKLSTRLLGTSYRFRSVKELLARANEARSGDELAGIAARSERERIAAKAVLANLTLNDLRENPVVAYDRDEVTRVIDDAIDRDAFAAVRNQTAGEFREWLLDDATSGDAILATGRAITAEIAAAVAKLCTNLDLIAIASKIRVVTRARTTLGLAGRLSTRLQPNHPRDDLKGIAAAIYEGLAYATGDALIGINPCIDEPDNLRRLLELTADIIERTGVPTQNCVLGHITTQMRALEAGAPMDIMFQSLAGTEKGNAGFGITVKMLDEGYAMIRETGRLRAANLMYFETGQGSELSAGAHEGADQVTLEARCYGLARRYAPLLVNTVVGFIGPEYLYDAKQITRAGLEDHLMGKLLGSPARGRRMLHQSRSRRSERLRKSGGAAGVGGMQLLHGGADGRRRDALLSIHQLSRRGGAAGSAQAAYRARVRALVRESGNHPRRLSHRARRRRAAADEFVEQDRR